MSATARRPRPSSGARRGSARCRALFWRGPKPAGAIPARPISGARWSKTAKPPAAHSRAWRRFCNGWLGQSNMAQAAARKKQGGFLPRGADAVLRRLAMQALGLVVIAVGLGIIASLLTYDAHDPSFNTATVATGTVANAVGRIGSHVADALLQALGPGA